MDTSLNCSVLGVLLEISEQFKSSFLLDESKAIFEFYDNSVLLYLANPIISNNHFSLASFRRRARLERRKNLGQKKRKQNL
jgi:hypothetical protein